MLKITWIALLLIFCCNFIYTQNERADSILNEYNRRFRMVLNKSDTIFVEQMLKEVQKNNCAGLKDLVESFDISNSVLNLVLEKAFERQICVE